MHGMGRGGGYPEFCGHGELRRPQKIRNNGACWRGWFGGMATLLAAHALVLRSLVFLPAGTGEQKSEARPTAPSRGSAGHHRLCFACTRPTDFAGGGAAEKEGRRWSAAALFWMIRSWFSLQPFLSVSIAYFCSLSMHVVMCF